MPAYHIMNGFHQLRSFLFPHLIKRNHSETGKKSGVDDYLNKPVDNELLLAEFGGRLRRAQEMQHTVNI